MGRFLHNTFCTDKPIYLIVYVPGIRKRLFLILRNIEKIRYIPAVDEREEKQIFVYFKLSPV